MKFCPNCGAEANLDAYFCGQFGYSLKYKEKNTNQSTEIVENESSSTKFMYDIFYQVKEKYLSNKVMKKILPFVYIFLTIFVINFGWNYFSSSDYREMYNTGLYLFNQGKYDEASKYFQKAHVLDIKKEDADSMQYYSNELSNI